MSVCDNPKLRPKYDDMDGFFSYAESVLPRRPTFLGLIGCLS